MVSVREQWENDLARVPSPHSHHNKRRRMRAFQICCAQLLLTRFKFISSCSKLADGARPQEGNTYRETGPLEKLCSLLSNSLTSNYSQGPEVLAEEESEKAQGRDFFFPLWKRREYLVRPCSPIANVIILVDYGCISWASFSSLSPPPACFLLTSLLTRPLSLRDFHKGQHKIDASGAKGRRQEAVTSSPLA